MTLRAGQTVADVIAHVRDRIRARHPVPGAVGVEPDPSHAGRFVMGAPMLRRRVFTGGTIDSLTWAKSHEVHHPQQQRLHRGGLAAPGLVSSHSFWSLPPAAWPSRRRRTSAVHRGSLSPRDRFPRHVLVPLQGSPSLATRSRAAWRKHRPGRPTTSRTVHGSADPDQQ
jgi:hypothetical protein